MDKINFRFLDYKTYNSFKTALNDGRILDDSIVFIKDKRCIWARGREYICDGPYTTNTDDSGNVTLTKGDGTLILRISQQDGVISITDSEGNVSTSAYATKKYLDDSIASKQDRLQAGSGISIDGVLISSTLDTNVYEFINELGSTYGMDPNKIYILEINIDGKLGYKQYKIKDGQWVLIGDVSPTVNLNDYLKAENADLLYQPKGDYLTEDSLSSYASIQYVNDIFVKKSQVYAEDSGGSGTGSDGQSSGGSHPGGGYQPGPYTIAIDYELNAISPNPVQNRAITAALQTKATVSQLAEKQDKLYAGKGIKIVDNVISTDLDIDNSVYVIVDELPLFGADENKIYLLREGGGDSWQFGDELPATYSEPTSGDYGYTQYKWNNQSKQWAKIGSVAPTIDLQNYISKDDAADFATKQELYDNTISLATKQELYQSTTVLATKQELQDTAAVLTTKEEFNQNIEYVKNTYVQKQAVYTEDGGIPGTDNPGWDPSGDVGITTRSVVNTVFLTKEQYDALVRLDLVKENVYYFTYESDEGNTQSNNWTFGGTFPITLI